MLSSIQYLVPILHVRNLETVSEFFVSLGFRDQWRMGEPAHRAVLNVGSKGEHVVQLLKRADADDRGARLYIQVPDVDAVYEACVQGGLNPEPLADREYGMRDFDVAGPEGILIGIGSEIEHP